jgi:hypothetical protein
VLLSRTLKLSPYRSADKGYHFHFVFSPISTIRRGSSRGVSFSLPSSAICCSRLVEPLHYRRLPWYQHGFICEALPKVSVILLHGVEDRKPVAE